MRGHRDHGGKGTIHMCRQSIGTSWIIGAGGTLPGVGIGAGMTDGKGSGDTSAWATIPACYLIRSVLSYSIL